jgi:hypothetical protein
VFYYAEDLINVLHSQKNIIVYGAGNIAAMVVNCLQSEFYDMKILCFAVSDKADNQNNINGIPVYDIKDLVKYNQNSILLIAVLEKYYDEIYMHVKHLGFFNIIQLTFESKNWSDLRENYLIDFCAKRQLPYLRFDDEIRRIKAKKKSLQDETGVKIELYVVKNHMDKSLTVPPEFKKYIIPIQVGSTFSDKKIAKIQDDKGMNISNKNPVYCELTAIYWIWKNVTCPYVGVCHYRRYFDIEEEQLKYLSVANIDVVLSIPILSFPDIEQGYIRDHKAEDWNVMMKVLKNMHIEYYETAAWHYKDIFYYPYNMMIAKKDIFDAYCEWLFPILRKIEQYCQEKEDYYQNRYIGFLAERLLSLYFIHNRNKYKVVHVAKKFYS